MFEIRERFDFQAALSKVVASDNPVRFGAAARTSDLSETSSCGTTDGGDALTAESKCPGQVRTRNNVEGPPVRIVHRERGAFDIQRWPVRNICVQSMTVKLIPRIKQSANRGYVLGWILAWVQSQKHKTRPGRGAIEGLR
jgi:hypothetical protein